ncbi:MAG: hypothetical protein Q9190_005719 [Brigantiaea leucoxantha]
MIRFDLLVKERADVSEEEFHDTSAPTQPHSPIVNTTVTAKVLIADAEALKKLTEDPFFKEVIEPDEEKFIDGPSRKRRVGYKEVYVDKGEAINNEYEKGVGKAEREEGGLLSGE